MFSLNKRYVITSLTLLTGCALSSGRTPSNDPAPNGTIVAQGQLSGTNGKSVSGLAAIYYVSASNVYVLRFEGLDAPDENGLYTVLTYDSGQTFQANLKSNSGNQNYDTGLSGTHTWSTVVIKTNTTTVNNDYGTASLH